MNNYPSAFVGFDFPPGIWYNDGIHPVGRFLSCWNLCLFWAPPTESRASARAGRAGPYASPKRSASWAPGRSCARGSFCASSPARSTAVLTPLSPRGSPGRRCLPPGANTARRCSRSLRGSLRWPSRTRRRGRSSSPGTTSGGCLSTAARGRTLRRSPAGCPLLPTPDSCPRLSPGPGSAITSLCAIFPRRTRSSRASAPSRLPG